MAHDVLIVDDEADIRTLIAGVLEDEGYVTRVAGDSDAALAELRQRRPSLLVLDIWLQGSTLDGLQLLDVVRKEHPHTPVVMISGHGTIETAVQAIKLGAYDFIEKPFQTDRLLLIVGHAIETARLRRENQELKLRSGAAADLTGVSQALIQVKLAVDRVAPTGSRVFITGPAGAGKEVAARMIHARSRRADGPFVVLNCATMAPDRVEVELFGAERGANGDHRPRSIGTFEQAHGGTLLLDEVCDMPLETQSKMIRVLQEQTFMRVGGATRIKVDVRVIAASNRDMQAEMAGGRFRQDLYYRLNVVPITVPPLKSRREDIVDLVRHFMVRSAEASGLAARRLGEDAMAALQSYDWPGNVRQLRNVVESMVVVDYDQVLDVDDLPVELAGPAEAPAAATPGTLASLVGRPLEEVERIFVTETLRFTAGNREEAAAMLGIGERTLYRKIKEYGL